MQSTHAVGSACGVHSHSHLWLTEPHTLLLALHIRILQLHIIQARTVLNITMQKQNNIKMPCMIMHTSPFHMLFQANIKRHFFTLHK